MRNSLLSILLILSLNSEAKIKADMDIAPTFGLDHKKYMITYSFTSTNVSHNIQLLYKIKIKN
jgi:hypothetical protein